MESASINVDEERLAHELISRSFITREDLEQCKGAAEGGAKGLLTKLVKGGFLTAPQARRIIQELALGQEIPGYRTLEKLGQGAMGTVVKARQLSMDRLVAIKVLSPKLAANPSYLERFRREAHIAAKLSHNNIVQAIDVGSTGKFQYFVMEYVEGTTIQRELDAGRVYEEREAVEIALQIAQALQHANRRQLIHRDIKPANIILTSERIAKLADLGLARGTDDRAQAKAERGLAIGTPFYIAPEQIYGREDIDCRADIYSLGATLYHMVTGQTPFPGGKSDSTTIEAVYTAHLEQELTPPDHINTRLSSGIGEVVEFMMAKDREQRYRSPDDLIIDLECLLNDQPPKLARQRIKATTLAELSQGEVEDERTSAPNAILWAGILGGLLTVSVLLNLFLLLKR